MCTLAVTQAQIYLINSQRFICTDSIALCVYVDIQYLKCVCVCFCRRWRRKSSFLKHSCEAQRETGPVGVEPGQLGTTKDTNTSGVQPQNTQEEKEEEEEEKQQKNKLVALSFAFFLLVTNTSRAEGWWWRWRCGGGGGADVLWCYLLRNLARSRPILQEPNSQR